MLGDVAYQRLFSQRYCPDAATAQYAKVEAMFWKLTTGFGFIGVQVRQDTRRAHVYLRVETGQTFNLLPSHKYFSQARDRRYRILCT